MTDIAVKMTMILGSMLAGIAALLTLQTPTKTRGIYLPLEPSKRAYESFTLVYTVIWILGFGGIVVFQLYESFDAWSYIYVCLGLALPFLLQPFWLPSAGFGSPDASRPLRQRYSFKANLWIAMYSFIGNYWYTHCKLIRTCASGRHSCCAAFFHTFLLQISIRSSRRNTQCQHIVSTMCRLPCSSLRTFTSLLIIVFPTAYCER